jgi:hypothetical protein
VKVVNVSLVKEDVAGLALIIMQCSQEFSSDISVGLPDYKIVESLWKVGREALGESFTWILRRAEAYARLSSSLSEGLLVVSG